ncbi:hypothetical protein [Argonema galeatum]|uniref:hypothetical protein n=1 Tax=Argonema galeatum TaxID=2942762 RepID=UPI002012204E|nr:hypothetical protein [Argonema galeatum]MCL1464016.1 hypothetical protein [Argonema galeatum A003/A1]
METVNIKQAARRLIDSLPENCTWDDLMYAIYVRQTVEAGLAHSRDGKIIPVEEVAVRGKSQFWERLEEFRQENNVEELGIEADFFEGLRDKSPGREVIL